MSRSAGQFKGDELIIQAPDQIAYDMLKRDSELMEQVKKKAAVVLGHSIRVRLGTGSAAAGGDMLRSLGEAMRGYDNMKVID